MKASLSRCSAEEKFSAVLGQVRGVILDLDGTLYNQKKLRVRMALELMRHCLFRPWLIREVLILFHFRRIRESLAEAGQSDVSRQQFLLTARKCHCGPEEVLDVVDDWLYRRPLRHLARYRYPLVDSLLSFLSGRQIMIAVLSDHPAETKLKALQVEGVFSCSSQDPSIDKLKPDPAGVLHICSHWGIAPSQCLVIGDRDDRDGEAARRAGAWYVVVPDGLQFKTIDQMFEDVQ